MTFTRSTTNVHWYLQRLGMTAQQTLGKLWVCEGDVDAPLGRQDRILFHCRTIERAWESNRRRESCIPPGLYPTHRLDESPSFDYPHFWVRNVRGRDYIKVHIMNYARQSEGCIGVGEAHTDLDGDGLADLTRSAPTLARLVEVMDEALEDPQAAVPLRVTYASTAEGRKIADLEPLPTNVPPLTSAPVGV